MASLIPSRSSVRHVHGQVRRMSFRPVSIYSPILLRRQLLPSTTARPSQTLQPLRLLAPLPSFRPLNPSRAAALLPRQIRFSSTSSSSSSPSSHPLRELDVGEIPGTELRIAPLRRVGEDDATLRARLVYQSRKRGTLESDLLLSTFADAHLDDMGRSQLEAYDRFLDENDWDIYYWATQAERPETEKVDEEMAGVENNEEVEWATAEGTNANDATIYAAERPSAWERPQGEWADTVGAFKPAHRQVPTRWRHSPILQMLRAHVKRRSVGGEEGERGMAFMPPLK